MHDRTGSVIRRDVYSVKVYDSAIGDWCHQEMTQNKDTARHYLRFHRSCGKRAKLVHPADWVAQYWLGFNGAFK